MLHKIEKDWLEYFKDWLLPVADNPRDVCCKVCDCYLTIVHSGRHALLNHEKSKKHEKNMQRWKRLQNEYALSKKIIAHLPCSTASRRSNSDEARVDPLCFTDENVGEYSRAESRHVHLETTPTPINSSGDPKECPGVAKEIALPVNTCCESRCSSPQAISESYDGLSTCDESGLELPHPSEIANIRDFSQTHSKSSQDTADQCLENPSSEKVGNADGSSSLHDRSYSPLSLDASDESLDTGYSAHLRSLDTCFMASTISMDKAAEICNVDLPFKSGNTERQSKEHNYSVRPGTPNDVNQTCVDKISESSTEKSSKTLMVLLERLKPSRHPESHDINKTLSETEIPGASDPRSVGKILTGEQTITSCRNLSKEMDQDIQTEYTKSLPSGESYEEKKADVEVMSSSKTDSIKRNNDGNESSCKTNSQPYKVSESSHLSPPREIFEKNLSSKPCFEEEIQNFLGRLTSAKRAYVKECHGIMEDFEKFLSHVTSSKQPVQDFRYHTFDNIFMSEHASSWTFLKLLGLLCDKKISCGAFSGERQLGKLNNVSSPDRKYFTCHNQVCCKECRKQQESEGERKHATDEVEHQDVKKRRFSS